MSDDLEAIYIQHCESRRYQDALKWSRAKTAALIEGAVLYAVYGTGIPDNVKKASLICGFVLVLIVGILIWIDRAYAQLHLDVMRRYEKEREVKFGPSPKPGLGTILLSLALLVLIVFNVYVFIWGVG